MFRALSFEAVREEHREATEPVPFVFRGRNELIDDDLRDIDEVTELRLPAHERIWRVERVAELETEHAHLRQRAVVDLEPCLVVAQVREARVPAARVLVVDHRVTVTEGAASHVLPGQPASNTLDQETAESEVFGGAPVDAFARLHDLALFIQNEALKTRMRRERIWIGGQPVEDLDELLAWIRRIRVGHIRVGATFEVSP